MTRAEVLVLDFITYRLSGIYPSAWLSPSQKDLKSLQLFENLSHKEIDRWLEVPIGYLSASEGLLVGMTKYFFSSRKESTLTREYFVLACESREPYLKALALYGLGILDLEQEQFESAQSYFEKAIVLNAQFTYAKLALVLCLVARGKWNETPKYLLQVSKIHYRPGLIYKALAALYDKIGLDGPNRFYELKSKKAEISFGLFFA